MNKFPNNHEPGTVAAVIQRTVSDFMAGPDNNLDMPQQAEPAFGQPLLGVATGIDSIWKTYKAHVGSFHWTPLEAFLLAFPKQMASACELSVICWILPQTDATKNDQRKERRVPSERWIRARVTGEKRVNVGLKNMIVRRLSELGIEALAPSLLPAWQMVYSERFGYASSWSERHVAHAAGMGTFGLCDGLITPVGKSVRIGSVIARTNLKPTFRPYTSHREYCLFFKGKGTCGKCIKRCPAGAISPLGHDKLRCKEYADTVADAHAHATVGFKGDSCGLCQTAVPCESGVPTQLKRRVLPYE